MNFNKILFFSLCLCLSNLQATRNGSDENDYDDLIFFIELEDENVPSSSNNTSIDIYDIVDKANVKQLDEYLYKFNGKREKLVPLFIAAIDNLLLGNINKDITQSRFKIVKRFLDFGIDSNCCHERIPVLAYVIKNFVKNMLDEGLGSNKVKKLVKLLVIQGANISDLFKIDNYENVTILSFVKKLYKTYCNYCCPWVKTLKEIADFLIDYNIRIRNKAKKKILKDPFVA